MLPDSTLNLSENFDDFIEDIRLLNVQTENTKNVKNCYGIIKSRSNERYWLLPLSSKNESLSGLQMFQPMTRSAYIGRKGIELSIKLGINFTWCEKIIGLNRLPQINIEFSKPVSNCAYFTGTSGPHRKSTIQFMSRDGSILGYAKLTRKKSIKALLSNETKILQKINKLNLKNTHVPKVLSYLSLDEGSSILVTDTQRVPEIHSPVELCDQHLSFLNEIYNLTGRVANSLDIKNLAFYLERVANSDLNIDWRNRLAFGSEQLKKQDCKFEVCLNHGDFTPWNLFLYEKGIYLFDWEYSAEAYPVGYDLIRFLFCLSNSDINLAIDKTIKLISEMYFGGNIKKAHLHFHISLLIFSAFYIERASVGGCEPWEESEKYADFIDLSLSKM